jgi:hypothetical protein
MDCWVYPKQGFSQKYWSKNQWSSGRGGKAVTAMINQRIETGWEESVRKISQPRE